MTCDLVGRERDSTTMSVNSLPSFAQAFSNRHLPEISPTLPPIRKRSRDPDRSVKNEDPIDSPTLLTNSKKRRLTISESAAPHPLRTDLRPPPTDRHQSSSTPISPVVMGFTVQRDNIDQVRSMISLKQKQKALIDQRRGSAPGIDEKLSSVLPRGISPTSAQHSSLPPPPISFARRRAALLGGKRKPADILISPDPFQQPPSVQSAPPTQNTFRLPTVAIPTLPTAIIQPAEARRLPGNVPPTPTRLSMQAAAHHHYPAQNINPIATTTTFVPPTPAALSPPYNQDKAAFLHPFERFYDALNDSRQLKNWLGDQLAKSGALMASLNEERERWDEVVDRAVDNKLGVYRAEVEALRTKVDELEDALTRRNVNGVPATHERESHPHLSHATPTPSSHLGVSRPEIQRRLSSPGWSGSAASVSTSSSSRSVASGSRRDREREMDTPSRTRRLSISGSAPTPIVSAPLAIRVKSLSSGVGDGRQGGVDDGERERGSKRGGENGRERERGRPKEGERRQRGRSTSPSRGKGRKDMGNLNHAGTGSGRECCNDGRLGCADGGM